MIFYQTPFKIKTCKSGTFTGCSYAFNNLDMAEPMANCNLPKIKKRRYSNVTTIGQIS